MSFGRVVSSLSGLTKKTFKRGAVINRYMCPPVEPCLELTDTEGKHLVAHQGPIWDCISPSSSSILMFVDKGFLGGLSVDFQELF